MADTTFRTILPPLKAVDNGDGTHSVSILDVNSAAILAALQTIRGESLLAIARGNVSGITHINKFGRNPDIDPAASSTAVNIGRTIWDGGIAGAVNWLAPTAARIHQIVSTDADDDGAPGGAGARTVRVYGLDANFALQQEDVVLNGTSNVATVKTYTMIYRIIVLTAGATGYNEGAITATADSDGTVTAKITAQNNQTLMAVYQIPAATKGYMYHYYASLHKTGGAAKFADVFLLSMRDGGVWRIRDATDLASDGSTYLERNFDVPKVFEAKELIQIVANPSADAQDISAGFDLILVDD